jgi:toxin FitB
MIILDTNVLSALMRQTPEERVVDWLDSQPRTSIWITSVTVLEVEYGLRIMAAGERRALLFQGLAAVLEKIGQRVAAFDFDSARHAAGLMASRHKKGRPGELRDTMIAGIVLAHRATLATRNTAHFEDLAVPIINPWVV